MLNIWDDIIYPHYKWILHPPQAKRRPQAARRVVQAVQLQRLSLARTKLLLVAGDGPRA
jgi:hypothetical protein